MAAELSTQSPTVEEEPIATIFSGSLDLKRASVRGNRAPKDRFEFAARQVSAVDISAGAWARAPSGEPPSEPPSMAAPMQAILAAWHTLSSMSHERLEKKTRNAVSRFEPVPVDEHCRWTSAVDFCNEGLFGRWMLALLG